MCNARRILRAELSAYVWYDRPPRGRRGSMHARKLHAERAPTSLLTLTTARRGALRCEGQMQQRTVLARGAIFEIRTQEEWVTCEVINRTDVSAEEGAR